MSRDKLLRWSGLAAMVSGALMLALAATLVLDQLTPAIPDGPQVWLRLGANVVVVLALMGIFYALSPWTGKLGKTGIVLAVVGLLLLIASFFPLAGWGLLLLGLLLFASASTRAGLRTGPGLWLWLTGSSLALLTGLMDRPVLMALGILLSGCGQFWLGCAARCEMPALGKVSRPEAAMAAQ